MRNINKMLKGVAFLMCLGFLAFAGNADAAVSKASVTSHQYYKDCQRAQSFVDQYDTKMGNTNQDQCNQSCCLYYQSLVAQADAANRKKAEQTWKDCVSSAEKYLSQANDALKECKKTAEAAQKAEKNATKKNDDLTDKQKEQAAAEKAMKDAEAAYNAKCQNQGTLTQECQKLLDAYEKAAKNAGKKANATQKAQNQAESAQAAAKSATDAAHRSSCPDGQVWSETGCHDPVLLDSRLGDAAADSTAAGSENDLKEAQQDAKDSVNRQETCSSKLGIGEKGELKSGFDIFKLIACKIMVLVADLRVIVYILSGFGLIAFAYGAIIGKINFKQLANIAIGLFILSMTTSFIEYFAYDGRKGSLAFGDFLPDGNHAKYMSNYTQEECANNPNLCPDVALAGAKDAAEGSSWSLKDLKNSINSARDAIKTASNTVKTVQNNVRNVTNAVSNIGNAIKNGGDPFSMVNNIVAGVSQISSAVTNTAGALASGASSLSNSLQDMTSTQEQLAYRQQLESEYNRLKAKCDHGNCSENERNALLKLQEQMNSQTTSVDQYLANNGKGGGSTILDGINQVNNMVGQAANATNKMNSATSMGQEVFGDNTLGAILGAANGLAEGYVQTTDFINNNKNNGNFDFRDQQTKDEEDWNAKLRKAQNDCAAKGGINDYKIITTQLGKKQISGHCYNTTEKGSLVEINDDGTMDVTRNNHGGNNNVYEARIDANGNIISSSRTQFGQDAQGNADETKGNSTSDFSKNPDGGDTTKTTDANGNETFRDRDANGNITGIETNGQKIVTPEEKEKRVKECTDRKEIYCERTGSCVRTQSDCNPK